MKVNEKIIRYVDGEMDTLEKKEFEKELENSTLLKEELSAYRNLLAETKGTQNIPVDDNYFVSVIPEFRLRQKKESKNKFFPGLAFGVSLAVIVLLFVITNNKEGGDVIPDNTLAEYTVEEVDSILNYYTPYYSDIDSAISNDKNISNAVDDMLLAELEKSGNDQEELYSYVSTAGYTQNITNLSSEEAEIVYNEILNKRFF
ncbi:MAG: hypothetical protein R6W90_05390 [Ignavibacteriaceae bacterium]